MQSLGVCFGKSVTSSIHLQGGKLSLSGISLVGWLRQKRMTLTGLARQCFKTWPASISISTNQDILTPARHFPSFLDILNWHICLIPMEQWTLEAPSTNSVQTTQLIIKCLLEILQPCWYAMTSKDFRSVSMSIGLGNLLDIHQHNHGISGCVLFKVTSNKTVNPYDLHHAPTFEESCCLGWIFHVTSADNRQSIETKGLLKDPRGGQGRSGRDSFHFMYHNDHSNGYIRMADGTTVPRTYRNPIYCVLVPQAALEFQLFLSKNGVILIYHDIPPRLLKIVDQMPTIACPVDASWQRSHFISYSHWRHVARWHHIWSHEDGERCWFCSWWRNSLKRFVQLLGISWDRTSPRTMECWSLHNPCQHLMHLTLPVYQFMDFSQEALNNERNLQMMMMMMMNPCVIHTRSQEEALINERHLEEALHKERHLNRTHQQLAGGKITDHHQDPLKKKKNVAKQMQQMTVTNHTSRRKMKSWKLQQPSGQVRIRMTTMRSSTSPPQHHRLYPWFLYEAGKFLLKAKMMEVLNEILQENGWSIWENGPSCFLIRGSSWEDGKSGAQTGRSFRGRGTCAISSQEPGKLEGQSHNSKRDKSYDVMRYCSENVKRSGCDWMRGQDDPNNWENRP